MTTHYAIRPQASYLQRLSRNIRHNLAASNEFGFVGLLANTGAFIVATPIFLVLRILKAIIETSTFGLVTLSVAPSERPSPRR